MFTTVEGVFRNGKIELAELPESVCDDTRVLVTFFPSKGVDLRAHGIDEEQAAELRASLTTFAEDWNSPDMELYDDYDAARARLQAGWKR